MAEEVVEDYTKGLTFIDFSDLVEDLSVNNAFNPDMAKLHQVRALVARET